MSNRITKNFPYRIQFHKTHTLESTVFRLICCFSYGATFNLTLNIRRLGTGQYTISFLLLALHWSPLEQLWGLTSTFRNRTLLLSMSKYINPSVRLIHLEEPCFT